VQVDSTTPDDLRARREETGSAADVSPSEAEALRLDLSQLREAGAQLTQEYIRIGEACHQAERRTAIATDALHTIETRLCRRLETVELLERRAAEATASFDRRVAAFEEQQHVFAETLVEARHVADVVSALEQRLAMLTRPGQILARVAEPVDQLDCRIAQEIPQLDAVIQAHRSCDHEPVPPQQRLERPAESALDNDGRSTSAEKTTQSWRRLVAVCGALAALALLGTAVIRTPRRLVEIGGVARAGPRADVLSASSTASPSKPLDETPFTRLSGASGRGAVKPTSPAASDGQPMASAVLAPTVPGASISRSSSMTSKSNRRMIEPASFAAPPAPAAKFFSGVLRVESVPSRATVFIDQQRVGETPLPLARLRAGSHVIWIERNGYERWSTAVLVATDQQTSVSAMLRLLPER